MKNPSTEWNKKERLNAIEAISRTLIDASKHAHTVPGKLVFESAERIMLIATESAYFLEMNRKEMLEGLHFDGHL